MRLGVPDGLTLLLVLGAVTSSAQNGETLARVRERGSLWCGVDRSEAEYSSTDEHGSRINFDLDLCKAVAVAALGPGAAVKATFYADDVTSREALASGKADLVASLSSDPSRVSLAPGGTPIGFSGPVLYDGVGLLVPGAAGVRHAAQLSGKKVCFLTETHVEDRLHAWFTEHHLDLLPFPFQEEGEMEAAFVTGNCAALGGNLTRLAETRAATGKRASDYVLLPETMGEDPLAMAYRTDDPAWKALVDGTLQALMFCGAGQAIEAPLGGDPLSRADAANALRAKGKALLPPTLSPGRTQDILAAVGSYGTLFQRDVGAASGLDLPSAVSALSQAKPLDRLSCAK